MKQWTGRFNQNFAGRILSNPTSLSAVAFFSFPHPALKPNSVKSYIDCAVLRGGRLLGVRLVRGITDLSQLKFRGR